MSVLRCFVLGMGLVLLVAPSPEARACGCFAPPDPVSSVLQAGERILFAVDGQTIEAHIQIQFSGKAAEFGWLLPLPSVPKLEVGTDELFARLLERVGPQFDVTRVYPPQGCGFVGGADDMSQESPDLGAPPSDLAGFVSPLVVQDSIGPYDYAVLKADVKQPMLDWLAQNRYFVPIGTDASLAPYIHKGAFFLALKLRSGKSAGDLQPVIVRYPSDLPMIPIVLTSVTSVKDMPVQVYVLGPSRAIPRNYYQTVINEAAINWLDPQTSYWSLVTRAVGEAKGKHSFVTEFAGAPSVMKDALAPAGRFGDLAKLRAEKDGFAYLRYLRGNGYPATSNLFTILGRYLPVPKEVTNAGIADATFYWNADQLKQNRFPNLTLPTYDPLKLTGEIEAAIVTPTKNAEALFGRFKRLTFLHTTLSPVDMNTDPVFSFNPGLPDVSNVHKATLYYRCGEWSEYEVDKLVLASGQTLYYENGSPRLSGQLPGSRRIEILRELGAPEIVIDNAAAIANTILGPPPPRPDLAMSPSDAGIPREDASAPRADASAPRDLRVDPRRDLRAEETFEPGLATPGCSLGRRGAPSLAPLLGLALVVLARRRRQREKARA